MKNLLFNFLSGSLGKIIGRNNLVRYGNFLTRAGRLDFPNGLIENGETLVQRSALKVKEKKQFIESDCGANKDEWTQLLYDEFVSNANHEQSLVIYSFEPSSYTYDKLLIELGEKTYVPTASKWPVELRLLFTIMINAGIFIISKTMMKKTGSNLMGMINGLNTSTKNNDIGGRKRKMKGPSVNLDDIPDN